MCKLCGRTYKQFNTTQNMCQTCTYNKYAKPKKPIEIPFAGDPIQKYFDQKIRKVINAIKEK